MSDHKLVVCPYDPVHRVKESRLNIHITKCAKNHLNEEKFTCPFNAKHVLSVQESKYHLLNCPDQYLLTQKLSEHANRHCTVGGNNAVPSYTQSQFERDPQDEVWEIDDDAIGKPVFTPPQPPKGSIIEPPANAKPSEKRKLYRDMHQIDLESETTQAQSVPAAVQRPTPGRQPTQISQTSAMLQAQRGKSEPEIGRGKVGFNRIAANIFPANSMQNGAPSYSAMASNFSNLGLGRGQQANGYSVSAEEYPSLGMGRGVKKA